MWSLVALLACHSPGPDEGASRVLTVENGFGGGTFPAGQDLHVWAGVDPQTALASWSGDVDVLDSPAEWNGGATMPDHDATLTAASVAVAAPLESRTYALSAGDRTVLGSFTASPVGLVLFFHGASYSVDELRANAARTLTMALVQAKYAVVAVPSEAEAANGVGGWNAALTGNTDLDNVRSLVDALRADGTVAAAAPVFALGMSSGGMFAHTVGAELPTAGVVAFCAPGNADAIAATKAPTAWYMAANDQTFVTGVQDATGFSDDLTKRGVQNQLYVHPTTPLYDERFTRVAGVDVDRSRQIAVSLRATGAVSTDDSWTVSGSHVTSAMDLDGLDGLTSDQLTAIAAEIEIMAADHELYDDTAAAVVGFVQGLTP